MQFGDPAIDRLKVITKKERGGGGVDHMANNRVIFFKLSIPKLFPLAQINHK